MKPPVALYRLFNARGNLLYIGITYNLGHRFTEHSKNQPWWPAVADRTVEMHDNRQLARLAELHAIYDEEPPFNVEGMWDGYDRDLKALPQVAAVAVPSDIIESAWIGAGRSGHSFLRHLTLFIARVVSEVGILDPDEPERFVGDPMEILSTRVSGDTLAALDKKRGSMSRAEALRRAIDLWSDPDYVRQTDPEPVSVGAAARTRTAPTRQSEATHRHVATKPKNSASGMMRCDHCDATKVGDRWVEP